MSNNPVVSNNYVSTNPDYRVSTRELTSGAQVQQFQIDIGTGTDSSPITPANPLPITGTVTVSGGGSSPVSSTASAPTFATIGTSTGVLLASNASRKGCTFVNDSSGTIYLGFGASAVVGSGIRLNANGGSFTMNPMTFTTQAINAISTSASCNVTVQEFT
jgi:hypothetical protein